MAPGWGAAYNTWLGWEPEWREGYGPLQIAAGVTLVGRGQSVVLSGGQARLAVKTEGVSFDSMHLEIGDGPYVPPALRTAGSGSVTMTKCTITGGGAGIHISCGTLKAICCTFVGCRGAGVYVNGTGRPPSWWTV